MPSHVFERYGTGRNFVIGPLHGARAELDKLLAAVSFNPANGDRIFCTGGLASHGPQPIACLDMLDVPWFHTVIGPDEYLLMHFARTKPPRTSDAWQFAESSGLAWLKAMTDGQIAFYADKLVDTPYVISIADDANANRVDILHAEYNGSAAQLDVELATAAPNSIAAVNAVFGRAVVDGTRLPDITAGVPLRYCGHALVAEVMRIGNMVLLDTGAHLAAQGIPGFALSGVNLANGAPVRSAATSDFGFPEGGGGGTTTTPPVTPPPDTTPPNPGPVVVPPPPAPGVWPPAGTVGTLFVSPSGSDSAAGTQAAPFKTIQKAASVARPGAVVMVAPGTYKELITIAVSGTASQRIRFISAQKWGAKITPASATARNMVNINGGYIDFEGFEVDGTGGDGIRIAVGMSGGNSNVRHCHIHHTCVGIPCDSTGGAALWCTQANGAQFNNYEMSNNVIHHTRTDCMYIQAIYHQSTGKIFNNLIYKGYCGIHMYHDDHNIDVFNNTVFGCAGYAVIYGGGLQAYTNKDANGNPLPTGGIRVHNNIIAYNGGIIQGPPAERDDGTNEFKNNITYKNTKAYSISSNTKQSGNVEANPLFVNYLVDGGGDYKLQAASPAINMGLTTIALTYDLDGRPRPNGTKPDAGCYEYYAPATPAPAPAPDPQLPPPTVPPVPGPQSSGYAPIPTNSIMFYLDSVKGNDANNGTSPTTPWKTLAKAQTAATLQSGRTTVVNVAPGSYSGTFSRSGLNATSRLWFRSTTRWAAKLPAMTTVSAKYIDIIGFEITDPMQRMGFWMTGGWSNIRNCHIHHLASSPNYVMNSNGGGGICAADNGGNLASTDYWLDGNWIHDIGNPGNKLNINPWYHGIYGATARVICTNNLVTNCGCGGIQWWHDTYQDHAINNTVVHCGFGILIGGGGRYVAGPEGQHVTNNNIVVDCTPVSICEMTVPATGEIRNNTTWKNAQTAVSAKCKAPQSGNVNEDPMFVSYAYGGSGVGDFHLRSGSPCIGSGVTSHAGSTKYSPKFDFDGKPRPAVPSRGAFEF